LLSKRNAFYCGIWAWNGENVKDFNINKFNTLGFFNDSRGGDSSGRYFDSMIHTGIDKYSKYQGLVQAFGEFKPENFPVAIGHARKASIGAKNHDNAQPLYVYSDTECVGVIAHNGTIDNIKELCTKHNIEHSAKRSDSYHLGLLIYKTNFDVLAEYEGTAAIIYMDFRYPGDLFVFKGASKLYKSYKYLSEEKPLFYYKDADNSVYVSSMEDSLKATFSVKDKDNKNLVKPIAENTVWRLSKGRLSILKKIDRKEAPSQNAPVIYAGSCSTQTHYSYEKKHWFDETVETSPIKDKLQFIKGRYHEGWGGTARGRYVVSTYGYIIEYPGNKRKPESPYSETYKKEHGTALYFVHGVLLKSKEAYKKLKILNESKVDENTFLPAVVPHAVHAVGIMPSESKCAISYLSGQIKGPSVRLDEGISFFSGDVDPFFSYKTYHFSTGDLTGISTNSMYRSLDDANYDDFEDQDTVELSEARENSVETVTSAQEYMFEIGMELEEGCKGYEDDKVVNACRDKITEAFNVLSRKDALIESITEKKHEYTNV